MRTETRQKVVDYNVYIAKDGKEFTSKDKCEHHEKMLSGERKECPKCHGKRYINERIHKVLNELTYEYEDVTSSDTCPMCDGKGYLEKTVTWK